MQILEARYLQASGHAFAGAAKLITHTMRECDIVDLVGRYVHMSSRFRTCKDVLMPLANYGLMCDICTSSRARKTNGPDNDAQAHQTLE